ncbi:META domain-containing protein [Agriterribacter sp.]|uniref:META domain-containing protein n=1 Tax=Agriterribacter sp. TaxID=2821509 RepID=UPI002D0BFB74|nr:META domain-containing protein [Agriterribacter sp.]HRO46668.1 META domain-containing protein [Agriterribacter sp.]HRQ17329.1 META domain-containing protein [Agriterribacter sp.]
MKQVMILALGSFILLAACKSANVNNTQSRQTDNSGIEKLNGTWELEYISGPRIAFQGLYPDRKPVITFSTSDSSFGGNTSCNAFSGKLRADNRSISFSDHMALTKMFCPGSGEPVFIETLKKINAYTVQDSTLTFMMDEVPMMRFAKKQ